MTERNAPCPCGSGKKFKKCCLLLKQSMKAKESASYTGEDALRKMISTLANNSIKNMEDAKINEGKVFTLEDFQILLNMACGLWNMSYLPAQRCRDLVENNIEQLYYRRAVISMISKMRGNSQISKLMITAGEASDRNGEDYPIQLETEPASVEGIEENMENTMIHMLDAIDFMLEHSHFDIKGDQT